jgi:hypothetical protein
MALVLSLIGVIRDQRKGYAIVMVLVSATFTILIFQSYGILRHSVPAFRPGVLTHP